MHFGGNGVRARTIGGVFTTVWENCPESAKPAPNLEKRRALVSIQGRRVVHTPLCTVEFSALQLTSRRHIFHTMSDGYAYYSKALEYIQQCT